MAKAKTKPKQFNIRTADIPNMVDAVFDPDHEMPGWVIMVANPKGRVHVEALFPRAYIAWREPGPGFLDDWRGFKINVPDVVAATETKLPLDLIPSGRTIDDSTPEQFAFLLAVGVRRDGGRAAIVNYATGSPIIEVFTPQES